jgi:sugar phosphate isomerase/epimerase
MVVLSENIAESFRQLREVGLTGCQISTGNAALFTPGTAEKVKAQIQALGVTVSTFWCGWPGPAVWDFYDGPITLGLAPAEYRAARLDTLVKGSDFAKMLGVNQIATHVGFIPENPHDPAYGGLLAALRYLTAHCKANGQQFLFETGQETPVTLLRMIEDLGEEGLGVNFDPANLLLYGKANPVDALDIIGKYVLDVHAKDGEYPTGGRNLGEEKPLGKGRVNFPALIGKLKALGYDGPITIEREISGPEQQKDILEAIDFLKGLI